MNITMKSDVGLNECLDPVPANIEETQVAMQDCENAAIEPNPVDKKQFFLFDTDEDEDEYDEMMEMSFTEGESGSGSETVARYLTPPCFLRKVLREELISDHGSTHRLLAIALHAVLLDSGLVQFDPRSNMMMPSFQMPDEWPSISLWYTLPSLINNRSEIIDSVAFRLQSIGDYTVVYGSLTRNGSQVHSVRLNEQRFGPTMWASKADSILQITRPNSHLESEVLEFWKMVKDHLVLPLLRDLCVRVGYEIPPCLMQLPTELKFSILELLPGVDVAKVACVCSELRCLSSNNDLWKQKFIAELRGANLKSGQKAISWKARFASLWEMRTTHPRLAGVPYFRPAKFLSNSQASNNPLRRHP